MVHRIRSEPLAHAPTDALPPHSHPEGQLLLVSTGLVTVMAEGMRWTLPPGCLGWMPPHVQHSARFHAETTGTNFYIEEAWALQHLPSSWCAVWRSPLLAALLEEIRARPSTGASEPYLAVLADQVARQTPELLGVPLPVDSRLLRMTDHLLAHPDDRSDLNAWATRLHMSRRTLTRRFAEETGMSWLQWRQQMRLMLALERLVAGQPVTSVALDMGYESVSAFITLFRLRLGSSPAVWLRQRGSH